MAFEEHQDLRRASAMSAYMRGLFPFLGIGTPERRRLMREALTGSAPPTQDELAAIAEALWGLDEREYQYAACDLLARYQSVLESSFLPAAETLILTKSWWDTVDGLATNVVGPLVARDARLSATMDRWIGSDELWLRRSALLFQLHYRQATDADRLFRYCILRAGDRDFFMRKAIGWVLREYSKSAPDAVRLFVKQHGDVLSPLSQREALLWLNRPPTNGTGTPG